MTANGSKHIHETCATSNSARIWTKMKSNTKWEKVWMVKNSHGKDLQTEQRFRRSKMKKKKKNAALQMALAMQMLFPQPQRTHTHTHRQTMLWYSENLEIFLSLYGNPMDDITFCISQLPRAFPFYFRFCFVWRPTSCCWCRFYFIFVSFHRATKWKNTCSTKRIDKKAWLECQNFLTDLSTSTRIPKKNTRKNAIYLFSKRNFM